MTWEMLENLYPNDHENLMKLVAFNALIKTKSKTPKLTINLLLEQRKFIKNSQLRKSATGKPTPRAKTDPPTDRQTERQTERQTDREKFVQAKDKAFDCKQIVFSWQECRTWALENFSVSDSKIDDFLTHLRTTFNTYENKSWIMANGERAKSPKALITSIMKKKYHLVKQKL